MFRIPSFLVIAFFWFGSTSTALVADEATKVEFLKFCDHVVSPVKARYQQMSYVVYMETSAGTSANSSIQLARTGDNGLFLRKSRRLATPKMGLLTTPPAVDETEFKTVLLGNSLYQAELEEADEGYVVSSLRKRDPSERVDIATEAAFGIPYVGTFRQLAKLPRSVVDVWRNDGNGMRLEMHVTSVSPRVGPEILGDFRITAFFLGEQGVCSSHSFLRKMQTGETDDLHYSMTYDDGEIPFLVEISEKSSTSNYSSRSLFRRLADAPLTEEECKLSAFGIPEPSDSSPKSHLARWLFVVGACSCLAAYLISKQLKRKENMH